MNYVIDLPQTPRFFRMLSQYVMELSIFMMFVNCVQFFLGGWVGGGAVFDLV